MAFFPSGWSNGRFVWHLRILPAGLPNDDDYLVPTCFELNENSTSAHLHDEGRVHEGQYTMVTPYAYAEDRKASMPMAERDKKPVQASGISH